MICLIDMTPKGRHEEGLPHGMAWVRHPDQYGQGGRVNLGWTLFTAWGL